MEISAKLWNQIQKTKAHITKKTYLGLYSKIDKKIF